LAPYAIVSVAAAAAIAYRHALWLSRPPTRRYWAGGWEALRAGATLRSLGLLILRVLDNFVLQRFIYRRSPRRWLAHVLISWGTLLAAAVTFPLVFGWVHFESVPGDLGSYRTFVFGFPLADFPLGGLRSALIFHALAISSVMVAAGCALAFHRRMTDPGPRAVGDGRAVLPLVLLFLIALTGILLTVSAHFLGGRLFGPLAVAHAAVVMGTLLYLPFGKLFHVFQRPAQIGVQFYLDAARAAGPAACDRCSAEFAPLRQVEDLKAVQTDLGFDYGIAAGGHYQHICPACRRRLVALAHAGVAAAGRARCPAEAR
jgi:hypothetical protein